MEDDFDETSLFDIKSDTNSGAEIETFGPDGEHQRYDPLGAASDSSEMELRAYSNSSDCERILDLEQQQEKLTSNLLALTSHFARVQFKLQQIIEYILILFCVI